MLDLNLYQKLIPYIENHPEGLTRNEIVEYLQSIAADGIGPTMIPRRISTILSWIRSLGIVEIRNERYYLVMSIINSIPIIELNDQAQPIFSSSSDLTEYEAVERKASQAAETITIFKNQAQAERANENHVRLVNLVADRIRSRGAIPTSNKYIDLALSMNEDYIFEMKSTGEENSKSQIRKGISQLYEYRYLQNKPDANLVLVIENSLPNKIQWMADYLENDRNILLVWDGDDRLYSSNSTKSRLPFLGIL